MICMSRHSARSAALSSVVTFAPLNHTSPDVGSMSRRMQRPVVDLPQPDSPTSPKVSPASSSKLTPLTACTCSSPREKTPRLMTKFFTRFFTRSNGSLIVSLSLQYARDLVAGRDLAQRRRSLKAYRLSERAARRETAAWHRIERAWHDAGDRFEAGLLGGRRIDARDRADQPLRIRVSRSGEQLADWRCLDHLAGVHHDDALG